MPDMTAITGLVTGINGLKTIAQAIIAERDAALVREKTTHLATALLDVLGSAVALQAEQTARLEEIDALKKKIAAMEDWAAKKARYALVATPGGAGFAMSLKKDAQGEDPAHWACQNCFEKGRLSTLQRMGHPEQGRGYVWACHECRGSLISSFAGPAEQPDAKVTL